MNTAYWLNSTWMWRQRGELAALRRATHCVAETQAAVLREILSQNRHTEFGVAHGFTEIDCPADFARRVPPSTYDHYREAIKKITGGKANVLTAQPVRRFEPTSGSSGGEKLIPYTQSLRAQFQRGVGAWIADLMQTRPAVRLGRAYWSISPALTGKRFTAGGIPIGFDDDTAYLGTVERFALKKLLAVPAAMPRFTEVENFRYCTLLHLIAAEDLALISIWSPTFLTAMLAPLEQWSERACRDLREGTVSLPNPDDDVPPELYAKARARKHRAARVESILSSSLSLAEKLMRLWPRLALISCWADGGSARYLRQLKEFFPHVEVQPKGLLATEAFVSFPLIDRPGAALAIRSHFFEFIAADGSRTELRTADQLERGGKYQVVVTTGGGLYRYQLGDVIEVVGFENQCPLVRFIGRADRVSDLVGEKLSEAHVREVLDHALAAHDIAQRFSMVVPMTDLRCYRLYLQEADGQSTPAVLDSLAESIELGLEKNPYYCHAIQMRQLSQLEIVPLAASGESAWAVYERVCLARGQRLGDIKPAILHDWSGWPEAFKKLVELRRTNSANSFSATA